MISLTRKITFTQNSFYATPTPKKREQLAKFMSPPISQHVKTTCNTGKKDYAERIFSSQTRHTISQCDPNKEAKLRRVRMAG